MAESGREKMCYSRPTSHKANPILTPKLKSACEYDASTKKKKCIKDQEEDGVPPDGGVFGSVVRNKLLEECTKTEIEIEIPHVLHSVTLFDSFLTDYDITGACLITSGGKQKLNVLSKSEKGSGILLNQKFNPLDKIQLTVTLVPRSGFLRQLVVFNFGSFTMLQGLAVHVLTDQESKMLDNDNDRRRARRKADLFWKLRHTVVIMDQYIEETDRDLPEYALPEKIEKFIEDGKYMNVEYRVTRENYQQRMHNLLYLEEYKQREDMSRYDLYDIKATSTESYSTLNRNMRAPPGYFFLKLTLEEAIFEGGCTISKGDAALLLPSNQQVAHECSVEHVAKEWVALKITEKAKQDCVNAGGRCSVRFVRGRIHMRSMHYAIDQLDLAVIFPTPCDGSTMNERSSIVMECLKELNKSELNKSQQEAITSMLDPAYTRVPSLVLGPFGCGKTRILNECIKLLASHVAKARILICTHSNSATNLYVEYLHKEWNDCFHSQAPLFRLYYTGRNIATIPLNVQLYCKLNKNRALVLPTVQELQSHKIVVATLSTSRALFLSKLPRGHFTHIFIDDAAQVLESEAIIPLCLATSHTKIVLAGDHKQMAFPVYSPIARKYGLQISLLERLYDDKAYDSGMGMFCKILLIENHRSHPQIMKLPSKLFYNDRLTCKAEFSELGPRDFPPIRFVVVTGQECQDGDSPSYYNRKEALKILDQVLLLVKGGLQQADICVLANYTLQVRHIRNLFRTNSLRSVQVVHASDVQSREYRALLISTVRTCYTEPLAEEEASFLTNPKMFNTVVTRAKQWLVVVGEPFTLCTVGEKLNRLCWMKYIRCCQQQESFDFTNADQSIVESLDYKFVVRQILEKEHSAFFSPHKHFTPSQMTPAPSHVTPAAYIEAKPQSKIKLVTQSGDEPTTKKITGQDHVSLPEEREAATKTVPLHHPQSMQITDSPWDALDSPPNVNELSLKVLSTELKTVTNPIQLGVGLGVPQHRLEIIRKNNPQDIGQQQLDLFSFIANNYIVQKITWERIADTLEEFVSMGDLAQKIRKKFINSGTSIIEDELSKAVVALDCSNKECITDGLFIFKDQSIGRGAFGTVFRGELDGDLCAVKILCPVADEIQLQLPIASLTSSDSTNKFRKECEFLESFKHPNIVRHLATKKYPKTNHLVLALELMDCNLRQYFTPKPDNELIKLSLAIQTSLCHDIASALEYIHSRGVIHRDLCGENILLSCNGETPIAKVCDFGMSRITKTDTQSVSLQAFAHKGFMPPEATDMESSCYNSKFDVYSFGALMVQIVRHLPTIKDRKDRKYELKLINNTHPIKELIMDCLTENRDDRPSAAQLKRRLS